MNGFATIPTGKKGRSPNRIGGRERQQSPTVGSNMPRKYVAFDIETAKVLPAVVPELKAHRPLGIACAATFYTAADTPRFWYGQTNDGRPSAKMSREDAAALVKALASLVDDGFTILTWNGLGFDFDILAEESGMPGECQHLARFHVDMMFHVFCERGFFVGLDRAAKAMRLPGKSQAIEPHMAPRLWAESRTKEVLDYVAQDVRATLELATACETQRCLRWLTQKGGTAEIKLPRGWLTVDEARRLPEPDTSWMDRPYPRGKFTDWFAADAQAPASNTVTAVPNGNDV